MITIMQETPPAALTTMNENVAGSKYSFVIRPSEVFIQVFILKTLRNTEIRRGLAEFPRVKKKISLFSVYLCGSLRHSVFLLYRYPE